MSRKRTVPTTVSAAKGPTQEVASEALVGKAGIVGRDSVCSSRVDRDREISACWMGKNDRGTPPRHGSGEELYDVNGATLMTPHEDARKKQ